MNRIDKVDVLKSLLIEPKESIYSLGKDLKKRVGEDKNVNYPTLLRLVKRLEREGYVSAEQTNRKDGEKDKRGTSRLLLIFKGLVYVALEDENLGEQEARELLAAILGKPFYQKFAIIHTNVIGNIHVDALKGMFQNIRPKVNLRYFDGEYVGQLLFEETIMNGVLPSFQKWYKENMPKARTNKEAMRLLRKMAKKDAKRIPQEWVKILKEILDYLRQERDQINSHISLLTPIIKYFSKGINTLPKMPEKGV